MSMLRHRSSGAAGLIFAVIVASITAIMLMNSLRSDVDDIATISDTSYAADIQHVLDALQRHKTASLRNAYTKNLETDTVLLEQYYYMFPMNLSDLVSEGFLNIEQTSLEVRGTNLLDARKRPILYFRSQLANYSSSLSLRASEGCQFKYSGDPSDGTLDVIVPSVAVIFPGGEASARFNGTGDVIESFHSRYIQNRTQFESNYQSYFSGSPVFEETAIRADVVASHSMHDMDKILVLDAAAEYLELENHVQQQTSAIASEITALWRDAYVTQIETRAQYYNLAPDQYMLLASTRPTQADSLDGWPRLLRELCEETNGVVFGKKTPTVYIGPNTGWTPSDIYSSQLFVDDWSVNDEMSAIKDSAGITPETLKDLVVDDRWLSIQQRSSLNPGVFPTKTLKLSCMCTTQNDLPVPCSEMNTSSSTYLDERDLYVRSMFLKVSDEKLASICPFCDLNSAKDECR